MAHILVLTEGNAKTPHMQMAIESLKKQATLLLHEVSTSSLNADQITWPPLPNAKAISAYIILQSQSVPVKFQSSQPFLVTAAADAILKPQKLIEKLIPASAATDFGAVPTKLNRDESKSPPKPQDRAAKRLVAVTACPTGIAHTFMAAEALKNHAAKQGYEIFVETQGSVGAKSLLTDAQIAAADAVIIAADTAVDLSRFVGKVLYRTSTSAALKKPGDVIDAALISDTVHGQESPSSSGSAGAAQISSNTKKSGPYQHLLTGVSYMLPMVVAGGLMIALSFIWGIDAFKVPGSLPAALMQIGGGAAFKLMVPVLAGFIAYSIADRPGLAPGLVGGWLAAEMGSGFLGGIVAGFVAGYAAKFIRDKIPLPENLRGLLPILIIPLFATAFVGLLMIFVIGAPMKGIMDGLTSWLLGLSGSNAILLGAILGAMMGFDLGGPTNKAAYAFTVGLLSSNTFGPMAATMAGGMTPPLAVALACFIARNKFTAEERRAGKTAGILGLCFISEGAIPFAARDPLRVIPSNVAGSALTGALSMYFGCTIRVPHGGVFVFGIPNAVGNLGYYVLAIAAGTLLSGIAIALLLKKPEGQGASGSGVLKQAIA